MTDHLEPAGACRNPPAHPIADDTPTEVFRPLLPGELVLVTVPARVRHTDRLGIIHVEVPRVPGVRLPTGLAVYRAEVEAPR